MLAGCANRPESISSSFVSHERYTGHECTLLTEEKSQAITSLLLSSDLQDSAANGDAIETSQIMQKCDYTAYVTAPKKVIVTDEDDGSDLSFAQ